MSDFQHAIPVILAHEGGAKYTNTPGDKGGPTKFGLSFNRFWQGRDWEDWPSLAAQGLTLSFPAPRTDEEVRALTQAQAEETYRVCWWDRFGYGRIDDQRCATKVFDMAVNMRRPVAHQLAQRAANDCGASLSVDGIFGERTVEAINTTESTEYLHALCYEHLQRYLAIVRRDPTQEKWLGGWRRRAAWPFHPVTTMEPSA